MLQRRDHPRLSLGWPVSLLVWGVAGASGAAAVYGISPYNLLRDAGVATPCTDRHPPLVDRVMFNGFAKVDISVVCFYNIYISTQVAWALAISWLILACVKRRGGIINTVLCHPVWIPLSRVQYCLYLLHRWPHFTLSIPLSYLLKLQTKVKRMFAKISQ